MKRFLKDESTVAMVVWPRFFDLALHVFLKERFQWRFDHQHNCCALVSLAGIVTIELHFKTMNDRRRTAQSSVDCDCLEEALLCHTTAIVACRCFGWWKPAENWTTERRSRWWTCPWGPSGCFYWLFTVNLNSNNAFSRTRIVFGGKTGNKSFRMISI